MILDPEMVERIARAIHEAYRSHFGGSDVVDVPWDGLSDNAQEANRAQARDIPAKLERIGCVVAQGDDQLGFRFTDAEVEQLAMDEHLRWMAQRTTAGWVLGERDDNVQHHPDLIPWSELTDIGREKDRDVIRNIPLLLAAVGLHVQRVSLPT